MSLFENRHLLKDVDLKKMKIDDRLSFISKLSAGELEAEIDEEVFDASRAMSFAEFQGQNKLKQNLKKLVEISKHEGKPLPHLLFTGSPGVGKTTLGQIMAAERGVNFNSCFANAIATPYDMYLKLKSLKENSILFLDEIHAIGKDVAESLYYAMEDGKISFKAPEQSNASEALTKKILPFTLIAATTIPGKLQQPLLDRFYQVVLIPQYTLEDMTSIISSVVNKLGYEIEANAAELIAKASRSTPRIAKKLCSYVANSVFGQDIKIILRRNVIECFVNQEIHPLGLSHMDIQYLKLLEIRFAERGAAFKTLCAALMTDKTTLENIIEPYLLKNGLIELTPRGRKITAEGLKTLNTKLGEIL